MTEAEVSGSLCGLLIVEGWLVVAEKVPVPPCSAHALRRCGPTRVRSRAGDPLGCVPGCVLWILRPTFDANHHSITRELRELRELHGVHGLHGLYGLMGFVEIFRRGISMEYHNKDDDTALPVTAVVCHRNIASNWVQWRQSVFNPPTSSAPVLGAGPARVVNLEAGDQALPSSFTPAPIPQRRPPPMPNLSAPIVEISVAMLEPWPCPVPIWSRLFPTSLAFARE